MSPWGTLGKFTGGLGFVLAVTSYSSAAFATAFPLAFPIGMTMIAVGIGLEIYDAYSTANQVTNDSSGVMKKLQQRNQDMLEKLESINGTGNLEKCN